MKSYEHLTLYQPYVAYSLYLEIVTTQAETARELLAEVARYLGGEPSVSHVGYGYKLSRLKGKDEEVYRWLIAFLCASGWEPYAAHSTGSSYREVHHFRIELRH